eukprot:5284173-Pleurochrysis_carterae.AAC.4
MHQRQPSFRAQAILARSSWKWTRRDEWAAPQDETALRRFGVAGEGVGAAAAAAHARLGCAPHRRARRPFHFVSQRGRWAGLILALFFVRMI